MGSEVEAFEEEWARYCGAEYCTGVSSGTDALYLALMSLGLPLLGNVLTTPFSFFATVQAILQAGLYPKFMDVDEDSGNIKPWDYQEPEGLLAMVPVHLYGKPAAKFSGAGPVIEDAAQAHGIKLTGQAACFSFYPTKNLGAIGQAGAMVTNSKGLADKVRELRTYGERERFVHHALTGNHRMDELQAAVLRVKLPYLDKWNRRRRKLALLYREMLGDVEGIRFQTHGDDHVYHIFAIRCKERDLLKVCLEGQGIQTSVRYPVPMHLQPALRYIGYKEGDFPNAEAWAKENLSLPMYPELESSQVEYVCSKIKKWVEER